VKRESHQKDGVITKRQRMVYDGNDRDDPEFAKEVAGSLGAFSTANQWSVDNLTEQLRHKCLLVEHLQNQIYAMEQTIRNKMSQDFEQIRAHDRQQIQQLQANLEELHQSSQTNQGLVTQRDELIEQLQARLDLTEGTSIDISAFQTQALEINEKLEIAQQDLFLKVDAIQKCYQAVDLSLKDIYVKEREARSARAKFQEAIILVQKDNVPDFPLLSPSEQLRGDMALKVWETNLAERKRFSREVKDAFLEALSSLDKKLIDFEGSNISEAPGKIDIEMNQQNSRKSKEETLTAIQEMSQIDLLKINKWLVNPSSQFQATTQEVKRIQEKLPQVERKLFTFEVNETIEPSRFVVELLDRCNQCIEHGKASIAGSK
jgi:hypothetical protein